MWRCRGLASNHQQTDMISRNILLYLAIIVCLVSQTHALPPMLVGSNDLDWAGSDVGDPLDPSFVGETMDMPMDPELIMQAKAAGIIKESNPLYKTVSSPSATYLGSTPPDDTGPDEIAAAISGEPAQGVNVSGAWSLDLIALDQMMKHLNLALVQNKDAIIGYGTLNSDNETHRITASGSEEGGRLMLAVTPTDSQDLYKLDLSLDMHPTGTYTAYSAHGLTWSGDIAGSAPVGILVQASKLSDDQNSGGSAVSQAGAAKNAAVKDAEDRSTPIRLGRGKI